MDQFTCFKEFDDKRMKRLESGKKKYGDGITNDHDLINDMEEELLDLANYAYLLYSRIQRYKNKVDINIRGKLNFDEKIKNK